MTIEEAKKTKVMAQATIINELLEKFDFKKVHAYLVLSNSKYQPTIEELKETARRLLEAPENFIGSAGFFAINYPNDTSLIFSIAYETSMLL